MSKILLLLAVLVWVCVAIDQTCPCPTNSYCLENEMCACDPGFIGNCTTLAIPVTSVVT